MATSGRPGDWTCNTCNHLNFQRRDSCQRCGYSRPTVGGGGGDYGVFYGGGYSLIGGGGGGFLTTGPDVRPGDWYCAVGNCGTHNFASRSTCFMCGAYKDGLPSSVSGGEGGRRGGGGLGSSRSAWKTGDWICSRLGCNEHNFASRMDCFGCGAPRDFDIKPSY